MSTAWKGGDDRPKFGRRGLKWFRMALVELLTRAKLFDEFKKLDARAEAMVIEWFAERATEYVTWEVSGSYSGSGFSIGGWVLDETRILAHCPRRVFSLIDAERFPTLDSWLDADRTGNLVSKGAIGGMWKQPAELRDRLRIAAAKRRGEIECQSCHDYFARDRARVKRCPDCREEHRQEKKGSDDIPAGVVMLLTRRYKK